MSHSYTDPSLPLTSSQMVVDSGMMLASGEAMYAAQEQYEINQGGSGINVVYPSPSNHVSGVYSTNPPEDLPLSDTDQESGIFHFNGNNGRFSNATDIDEYQITDFETFSSYIHYGASLTLSPVYIPYLSDFQIAGINSNPFFINISTLYSSGT